MCSIYFILTACLQADGLLDLGLMVLYGLVFQQSSFLPGHESSIFAFLLNIRYAKKLNVSTVCAPSDTCSSLRQVFEATNAIRDSLIETFDPILGLATVHRSLVDFLKKPAPDASSSDVQSSSYCFCLVAIAKFILLLPSEVLEDELPRIRGSLITVRLTCSSTEGRAAHFDAQALGQPASQVREAAYVAIIAAQVNLRDESHLFAMLSGLSDSQKNLLTYQFEQVKVRGPSYGANNDVPLSRLQARIGKLDALGGR